MRARFLIVAAVFTCAAVAAAAPPPPDRTPPTKPTIDGAGETSDLRPILHFGARDNRTPPSRIRFRCSIDSPLLHACARISRPASALAFGQHVVRVRAIDLAGNASAVASATITIVGTWDAAVEFPRAPRPENPGHDKYGNTTWLYLYSTSTARTHDPTLYQPLPNFSVISPGWEVWFRTDGYPQVGVTGNSLHMHPDVEHRFAVLGWRSPYTGKVTVEMQRLRLYDPAAPGNSNGVIWSIDLGGSVLQTGLLTPTNEASTSIDVNVTTGDTLYLVIDDNGDYGWDSTSGGFRVRTAAG